MDLFVAPTIDFDLLYVLVIIRLERRNLVWINVRLEIEITRDPAQGFISDSFDKFPHKAVIGPAKLIPKPRTAACSARVAIWWACR
jgi:hypothetical protein